MCSLLFLFFSLPRKLLQSTYNIIGTESSGTNTADLEAGLVGLNVEDVVEDVANAGGGARNADRICGNKVIDDTRAQYFRTYKFICAYCVEKLPDAVDEHEELRIPMQLTHVKTFLGDMSKDRADGSVKANSTVGGYVTVIKHYYKERKVMMDFETDAYLKNFTQGYKRVVAEKKNLGKMKQFEGKVCTCTFF